MTAQYLYLSGPPSRIALITQNTNGQKSTQQSERAEYQASLCPRCMSSASSAEALALGHRQCVASGSWRRAIAGNGSRVPGRVRTCNASTHLPLLELCPSALDVKRLPVFLERAEDWQTCERVCCYHRTPNLAAAGQTHTADPDGAANRAIWAHPVDVHFVAGAVQVRHLTICTQVTRCANGSRRDPVAIGTTYRCFCPRTRHAGNRARSACLHLDCCGA